MEGWSTFELAFGVGDDLAKIVQGEVKDGLLLEECLVAQLVESFGEAYTQCEFDPVVIDQDDREGLQQIDDVVLLPAEEAL